MLPIMPENENKKNVKRTANPKMYIRKEEMYLFFSFSFLKGIKYNTAFGNPNKKNKFRKKYINQICLKVPKISFE